MSVATRNARRATKRSAARWIVQHCVRGLRDLKKTIPEHESRLANGRGSPPAGAALVLGTGVFAAR